MDELLKHALPFAAPRLTRAAFKTIADRDWVSGVVQSQQSIIGPLFLAGEQQVGQQRLVGMQPKRVFKVDSRLAASV